MNTPIADFVKKYSYDEYVRFHMPGHKGNAFLGCEAFDITEVKGADSLYEANGIIEESAGDFIVRKLNDELYKQRVVRGI